MVNFAPEFGIMLPMNILSQTPKESVFYEDSKVTVALAFKPLTAGHSIVIWKNGDTDINKLNTDDYEYLMDVVDVTRDTLREFFKIEKVYLMYLDETNWVHWHLIPRYNEKGFSVLSHEPEVITDFKNIKELAEIFSQYNRKMMVEN